MSGFTITFFKEAELKMNENPTYYAIIPASVRYDKRLKANEKLLYGEITALTNKTGECWATNKYFAELYDVTAKSISGWVNNLKECGYITVELIYNNNEVEKRIIKIVDEISAPIEKKVDTPIEKKVVGGIEKKVRYNNININNINNNNIYEKQGFSGYKF